LWVNTVVIVGYIIFITKKNAQKMFQACAHTQRNSGHMIFFFFGMQGDSGGKVNIFGGDSIGHCEKKIKKKKICV